MFLGSGKGRVAQTGSLALGTDAKYDRERGKWGYIGSQPKGKTDIPVNGIRPLIQSSFICGDKNQLP
jgi:hypothetical protein